MNKYFDNISTLEELRKQYKELLKLHHPDNGGILEIMQEINAEYDRMFKILKNQHENNCSSDRANTNNDYNNMKYDFAEDEKLREMLNKIIHFNSIDIELVGAWIWLSGNTYAHKKELKELGFRWASLSRPQASAGHRKRKCGTGILRLFAKRAIKLCRWMTSGIIMEVQE